MDLLLLADEQESMIDRYLERGSMYVLEDPFVKAECIVTNEGNGVLEIENIATAPAYQGKGYGKHSSTGYALLIKISFLYYRLEQVIVLLQCLFMKNADVVGVIP